MVVCGNAGKNLGDSMYDGTIYVGGEIRDLGVDAVPGELTDLDRHWLTRKLTQYDLMPDKGVDHFTEDRRRQAAVELRQPRADRKEAGALRPLTSKRSVEPCRKVNAAPNGLRRPPRRRSATPASLGQSRIFTPEVIDDIHIKAELGRYRMRGFLAVQEDPALGRPDIPAGHLTRFVIEGYREKCETKTVIGPRAKKPIVLDIPVYVTGMSFGALSATRPRPRWPAVRPWPAPRPVRAKAA